MMHFQNPVHGLHSPGILARFPLIGVVLFVLGSVGFGLLAYQVRTNGGFVQGDMIFAKAFRRELVMLQISTQGGGVIWNLMIGFFSRERPAEQLGLATSAIPSFPSGHALGTMIGYGFLAFLLIHRMPSIFWKWTAGIAILLLILFEGFSRIFHGNHYLTDLLAGYALGIVWLVLVCTLIESTFVRRAG